MSRRRVLIADDHGLVVEGLCRILEASHEIVGTAADGHELTRLVSTSNPDLIIVDISMPTLNGIEAIRHVRKEGCTAKVLCLTMHPDLSYVTEAIDAGAQGYILKNAVTSDLLQAIESLFAGGLYLPPSLRPGVESALADLRTGRRKSLTGKLTVRQREVLQLIAEGHSSKEIGSMLHISERTAHFHKQKIKERLGLRKTAELVREAVKLRLVDRTES